MKACHCPPHVSPATLAESESSKVNVTGECLTRISANASTDSQIHQASIEHAPFQNEESWVDSVAEARGTGGEDGDLVEASAAGAEVNELSTSETPTSAQATSDPTIAHAGLTELDTAGKPNGVADSSSERVNSLPQGNAGQGGNTAGDRWDTSAPGAEKSGMEDSYEMVPRPQDELEVPDSAAPQEKSMSWADEPPAAELSASSNQAGEGWDTKAPGDQTDNTWSGGDAAAAAGATAWTDGNADATAGAEPQTDADGFHQVGGRQRGRGRGRGDGEFRGRGRGRGGYRGDGEFRGRGRGGFRGRGDGEYRGRGDGEYRGRGGRGRGPRGAGGISQTYDNA